MTDNGKIITLNTTIRKIPGCRLNVIDINFV